VAPQEIDVRTNRTNDIEQLEMFRNMTQMNHYFSPTMTYDGGYYGMGLLSTTPIDYNISDQLLQHFLAESKTGFLPEPRTVGVIQTNISDEY